MDSERWKRIDDLLEAAFDVPPGERSAFLDRACAGDEELRREVEALLDFDRDAGSFLESPALDAAADLLAEPPSGLAAGRRIGHYTILSRIGSGGMGEVYLAEDTRLGRRVALKLLPTSFTADARLRARFLREARLASTLDHPSICTIHEVGRSEGHFFIAMQYVEGATLKELVEAAPLSLESLLSIGLQAADAIAAAHGRGIVHRDIKSSNIVVTDRGRPVVLDFGLARLMDDGGADGGAGSELTGSGMVLGTPNYMSPEQARGGAADHRSDIFSLGVVIYEMVAGRVPFERGSQAETLNAVIHEPHTPLAELNESVPAELSATVDRALSKDPAGRHQSTEELLLDLRRVARAIGLVGPREPEGVVVPYAPPKRRSPAGSRALGRWALVAGAVVALAAVLLGTNAGGLRARLSGADARAPVESLAVLPLENLSGDPGQDYFADGMTEALITELAKIGALRVISRTSVMRYKGARKTAPEIARELGVDAVVEGAVVRSGGRVRVSVQLIRASTDEHLWAESYERDVRDVLPLQDEVARAIAGEIRVNVTPRERQLMTSAHSPSPEAHEAYLQGLFLFNRGINEGRPELLARSREDFERAIGLDPGYAQAYVGLAHAYHWQASLGVPELYPKAKAAAERALELDDTLAEAHSALAFTVFYLDRDRARAEREYRRAIELNPGNSDAHYGYAIILSAMCRHDEAIAEIERAEELDPLTLALKFSIAYTYSNARQYDRAIERFERLLELNPNNADVLASLGKARVYQDRSERGVAELRTATDLSGNNPAFKASLAWAYAMTGRRAEAIRMLDELERSPTPATIPEGLPSTSVAAAQAFAALGDADRAFAWLERAYEERSDSLLDFLECSPEFDSLRPDPRYDDLMRRAGFSR